MHELPLVFFTVFAQVAAGIVLLTTISTLLGWNEKKSSICLFSVALLFTVLGLGLASLHLGQPFRSFNVLKGLTRSVMSQEIILFSLFAFCTACYLFLVFFKKGSHAIHQLLMAVAAVMSLVLVWAIARVYNIETVVTWATHHTTVLMFVTMLVTGGVIVAAFGLLKIGVPAAIIGLIASFATKPDYINYLTTHAPALTSQQTPYWMIQAVLLSIAIVCVIALYFRRDKKRSTSTTLLAVVAMICVICAELAGRITFYNLWSIPM